VVEGFLTGGEVHDVTVANELTEDVVGCRVAEDRGYDSDKHRSHLESNNNTPLIPGRKNRKKKIHYDREVYKLRGRIETIFGKIKENRRLAVRYEKSDVNFLCMIAMAFIVMFLRWGGKFC
jgi:IS5 family transposase